MVEGLACATRTASPRPGTTGESLDVLTRSMAGFKGVVALDASGAFPFEGRDAPHTYTVFPGWAGPQVCHHPQQGQK